MAAYTGDLDGSLRMLVLNTDVIHESRIAMRSEAIRAELPYIAERFDLICTQEISHAANLAVYHRLLDLYGFRRIALGIYYKPRVFELIASDLAWLTPDRTPDCPGWDAHAARNAAWGLFWIKAWGIQLTCISPHLDNVGVTARPEQTKICLELGELIGAPNTILAGDFNIDTGDIDGQCRKHEDLPNDFGYQDVTPSERTFWGKEEYFRIRPDRIFWRCAGLRIVVARKYRPVAIPPWLLSDHDGVELEFAPR